MGAHFSGNRVFQAMSRQWWWGGMHADLVQLAKNCPECTIVSGGGRVVKPPLHPIEVQRPFQIIGVDIMDLPLTDRGNRHVLVFQDHFTKWPMVYPIPDQKSQRIVQILCDEIIPFFGVPEALLSDQVANLLSHLMMDICEMLGIKKLSTTSYHPQCNVMVERLNRTLKSTLRKQAAKFGMQWDQYLPGVLWAYRNTPHESTVEKPSFLLFGMDLRTPSDAALFPPSTPEPTTVEDYRVEVMTSLSSARALAAKKLKKTQEKSKIRYDQKAKTRKLMKGDWVLVKFPQDEMGRNRKLSQPWHGPYRVLDWCDTDVLVEKVYRTKENRIRIHQSRVTFCSLNLPPGYYWYGRKHCCPGKPPQWVASLFNTSPDGSGGTLSGSRVDDSAQSDDTRVDDNAQIDTRVDDSTQSDTRVDDSLSGSCDGTPDGAGSSNCTLSNEVTNEDAPGESLAEALDTVNFCEEATSKESSSNGEQESDSVAGQLKKGPSVNDGPRKPQVWVFPVRRVSMHCEGK